MVGALVRVINSGKPALDEVMLEMGRRVAESVMLIEREEIAGPDYYPSDPTRQKWAHEAGSIFRGDPKVTVTRPRLRHVEQGEVPLQSDARVRALGRSLRNGGRRSFVACRPRNTPTPCFMRPRRSGCPPPWSRASSWI